jgi:16S rRNA (uracil1498-N3)-methyltransferase
MSRFFVPKEAVRGKNIFVKGDEAHHIINVMRLKADDKVVTFDGTGNEYVGFIKEIKRKDLVIEIIETKTPLNKESSKIILLQAIPKKDKMDYVVEKSTELGVRAIVPFVARRSIPDWDGPKKAANVDRWRKIAREAAKQCGRSDIPDVGEIKNFSDIFKGSDLYDLGMIAALIDNTVPVKCALKDFKGGNIALAIGPEGDFTPDEVRQAVDVHFKPISLGPRVLKSDTAGLAALAMINYEFSGQ